MTMTVAVGLFDQITQAFLDALHHQASHLRHLGEGLFYYLAVIQLALNGCWLALHGAGLHELISRLVPFFLSLGLFYGLILHGGVWLPDILNGFIEAGRTAGVTALDPSSIMDQGAFIASNIFKAFSGLGIATHPFVAIVGSIVCLAIIVIYALIAAELTVVLVKTYVVVAIAPLFFAFGATEWTREMTRQFISAVLGLGLHLMTLYLLLGVGQHTGEHWVELTTLAVQQHDVFPLLIILGACLVYYLLIKAIPPFVASLAGIGGFRHYGSALIGTGINQSQQGVRLLQSGQRMVQQTGQGIAQVGLAGHHWVQAAKQAPLQNHGSRFQQFTHPMRWATRQALGAMQSTLKERLSRSQPSVGQTFNDHFVKRYTSQVNPRKLP